MIHVGIVGLGFVGLTLSAHLTKNSCCKVFGFEIDMAKANAISSGNSTFYEPGLTLLLEKSIGKNLFINDETAELDCIFITVGTPIDKQTSQPNLTYVRDSVSHIVHKLKTNGIIYLRSTVSSGVTAEIQHYVCEVGRSDVGVCFAPERTVEGDALSELEHLPQIYGAPSKFEKEAKSLLLRLGFKLINAESPENAEFAKLLSNTYRDMEFSMANLFAMMCSEQGCDYEHIRKISTEGYDRNKLKKAGFVSGPCLSKDAFIMKSRSNDPDLGRLITFGRTIEQKMIQKCIETLKRIPLDKFIFTGIAFKGQPATSDIRDSSVLPIIKEISVDYKNVWLHDYFVSQADLLMLSDKVLTEEQLFDVNWGDTCLFIGNNNDRYLDTEFLNFIGRFLANGNFVYDSWGILDLKHKNLVTLTRDYNGF